MNPGLNLKALDINYFFNKYMCVPCPLNKLAKTEFIIWKMS